MNRHIACATLAAILAAPTWCGQVRPGHYDGKGISVREDLNGTPWAAEVTETDGTTVMVVKRIGKEYREEWTWNDTTLVKREFSLASAGRKGWTKIEKAFHATNEGGKYRIDCKDRAAGDCDGGMEPTHYWVLISGETGFRWESWGTPKGRTGNPVLLFTVDYQMEK